MLILLKEMCLWEKMKNNIFIKRILILVFIAVILFLFLLLFPNDKKTIQINDISVQVGIADTQEKRIQGLSLKESLGKRQGMLFVFDGEDLHEIWMKNMNFAIDILWIDEGLRIVDIKQDAKPESYPEIFRPKTQSMYIIEVNAGFVKDNNITIGDMVIF